MAEERFQRKLAAILAADVVGYSRLMGEDEEATAQRLNAYRKVIDELIAGHHGRVFGTAGDSVIAEFASPVEAVRCAVEIQRNIEESNVDLPEDRRMRFRIGVNLGDVMVDGENLLGDGVNVAARLEGLTEPGGISISRTVFDHVDNKLDVGFESLGEQNLKNIAKPVRTYRVLLARPSAIEAPPPLPDKPSIAVLPFTNMSGDPEQEFFADGIAEDLITSLSKLSQLFVIARNSSFTYKGRAVKVQEIAEELGVRYVVEGSVRKAGNRVRITAQLIDCTTGGHLWAERFDRELTDIFAVQDEVTQEIVSAMALKLTADEERSLIHQVTKNLEAYDYFLRGREQHWLLSKEANAQAKAMLKRAIDLDPGYAPAHAFLAEAHLLSYINRWDGSADRSLEQAHEHAQRAVTLDETYPQAHGAMGHTKLWKRQHDRAIAEYKRATALDPNFARGHIGLGRVLLYAGRSEEVIELVNRGLRLDPHYSDIYLHILAQAYFQLNRYEEAIDLLKRRIIRNPETDISRVLLAASYGHLGRVAEARTEWAEALRVNPDYSLEHRRQILPYKDPCDFDCLVEGLRKAGLPE